MEGLKKREKFKVENFKTLQHNTTCMLHINSSNLECFVQFMILIFLLTDTKI